MNVVLSADLWYPARDWDPLGTLTHNEPAQVPDPTRYVVWVDPGRGNTEQAPRLALHVGVFV